MSSGSFSYEVHVFDEDEELASTVHEFDAISEEDQAESAGVHSGP